MLLVGRAMPLVEAQLTTADKTILLIYAGLLARYDQMVRQRSRIPESWLENRHRAGTIRRG